MTISKLSRVISKSQLSRIAGLLKMRDNPDFVTAGTTNAAPFHANATPRCFKNLTADHRRFFGASPSADSDEPRLKLSRFFRKNESEIAKSGVLRVTQPVTWKYHHFYVNQGYSSRHVSVWLYGAAGLILLMISIGGYTRLTRSGLSMTRWKPVGYRYPASPEQWDEEFGLYKLYPEFAANPSITMAEFKRIFNVEFVHRLTGNVIGLYFALPMLFFWKKGYFTRQMKVRSSVLLFMGGVQGLIGWWMVKSGLDPKPEYQSRPRVSTYRLVAHNFVAVCLYY